MCAFGRIPVELQFIVSYSFLVVKYVIKGSAVSLGKGLVGAKWQLLLLALVLHVAVS